MKNLILTILLATTTQLLADELSWVNEQIQAIKPPRVGMKSRDIAVIRTPFLFTPKNVEKSTEKADKKSETKTKDNKTAATEVVHKKPSRSLMLSLIMNAKAMINGNWYRVGDSISGYKVAKIGRATVSLRSPNNKLLLSTRSKTKKLKFQK